MPNTSRRARPWIRGRDYLKRQWPPIALGAAVLALTLAGTALQAPFVTRLEAAAYDLRLNATLPERRDERIVIVDIDDASLEQIGRWPWSRDRFARLLDNLFAHGAALVVFDIVFAQDEERAGMRQLEQLVRERYGQDSEVARAVQELKPRFDPDRQLAASLQGRPVVLAYFFDNQSPEARSSGALPPPVAIDPPVGSKELPVSSAYAYGGNIALLQNATRGAGFITVEIDEDGILRRMPLLFYYQDRLYPGLALEAMRVYLGVDAIQIVTEPYYGNTHGIERIVVGGHAIPTDEAGRVLVPYLGAWKSFPYVSAAQVVNGTSRQDVKGKIVLVGSTATALYDLHATPVHKQYPGVEVQANIISGILDKHPGNDGTRRFYHLPSWALGANVALIFTLGLILILILPGRTFLSTAAITVAAGGGVVGLNLWLWANEIVLGVAMPLLLVFALFVMNVSYGYLFESRRRSMLLGIFGQYVPRELVAEMARRQENFGWEGDNREMTVLFCDIREFTALSENLSPADVKALLNRFFTHMTRIIQAHRGTIDKYVGDMIMAFWGAPLRDEKHARHALDTAMAMLQAETDLAQEFERFGLPRTTMGIGINSGNMNVGNMGSEFRMAYTVIGDAVNLASRLERLTRAYGSRLIVSESTRAGHDGLIYREIDRVRVKGKHLPVAIYEPLAYRDLAAPKLLRELELYNEALRRYRDGDWDAALARFAALKDDNPQQPLYSLYIERIRHLLLVPPVGEWQGVFEHQ